MPLKKSEIYLFFDDGNVLNDNEIRAKRWQKLIGQHFTPLFGGKPDDWGAANTKIIKSFINKEVPLLIYENKEKTFQQFIEWFIEKWINDMFDYVGIQRPEKSQYKRIYYEAAKFVDLRVKAAFPGVINTIRILFKEGYNLYTASGTESIELKYYLKGVEIKKYFKNFYGPDLINLLKVDAAFYKAIFNDLNIQPNQAIIIDDKPYYLKIAESLGAHIIQACLTEEFGPEFNHYIRDMNNLPEIIEKIRDVDT